MKRETINYFSVGLFVLAGMVTLLYVSWRISSTAGNTDVYYTHYRNVGGLSEGTRVTYEGYQLGQIARIEPQRGEQGIRYRVELRIKKDWKIPEDSIARVQSEGLLAETVVNITEGRSRTYLAPGDELDGEKTTDLFAALGEIAAGFGDLDTSGVGALLDSLNKTARELDSELGKRVPAILDDVQGMVTKLDTSAGYLEGILNAETQTTAQRIISNTDQAAADFRDLTRSLVELKNEARQLLGTLDGMITDARPEVQQSIVDLRRIMEQVAHYSDGILHNLDTTSRNMNEFSRQIRENPGRLIGGAVSGAPGKRYE